MCTTYSIILNFKENEKEKSVENYNFIWSFMKHFHKKKIILLRKKYFELNLEESYHKYQN